MIPLDTCRSEPVAADLLQLVRWRNGVECSGCDCSCNDKTGTIVAQSKIALQKRLYSIEVFSQFNTSLWQLIVEIAVSHKPLHRHVECFTRALDTLHLDLVGSVDTGEEYVFTGLKGREYEDRTLATNHPSSSSSIEGPNSATSSPRNPPTNRPCDSC